MNVIERSKSPRMSSSTEFDYISQEIALFQMVNNVPDRPSRWHYKLMQQEASSSQCGQQLLNIEHEIRLVEAFAFIAHYTEDPAKVSAVAVQIEDQGLGLRVFVSVNRGSAEVIVQCFDKVFVQLPTWSDSTTILPILLDFHRNKCLSMLRSRHAHFEGNFPKQHAKRQCPLELFAKNCAVSNIAKKSGLLKRAVEMRGLFRDLEAVGETQPLRDVQIMRILVHIVDVCHQVFKMQEPLSQVLSSITNVAEGDMLRRRFSYFSHFHVVCRELRKARQRLPGLERAVTEVIKLEPRPNCVTHLHPDLDSMLHAASRKLRRPQQQLKEELLSECQRWRPVHAEIQLAVHLGMVAIPSTTIPRVIRSGKEACFLCHAFFAAQGRFVSLGTHGRLYEKWALPRILQQRSINSTDAMQSTLETFQSNLRLDLLAVLGMNSRKAYPFPVEDAHFLTPAASSLILCNSSPAGTTHQIAQSLNQASREFAVGLCSRTGHTISPDDESSVGSSDQSNKGYEQTTSFRIAPDAISLRVEGYVLQLYFDYSVVQSGIQTPAMRQTTAHILSTKESNSTAPGAIADIETLPIGHCLTVPAPNGLVVLKLGTRRIGIRLPWS